MLKEFRDFAMRGNVVDLAVGIVLGVAFGDIVNSLVNDILMPPIGLLLGKVDFSELFFVLRGGSPAGPYTTADAATTAGAVIVQYGEFINTIISFVIVAFAMFLVVRAMNRLQKEPPADPTTKTCPHCLSEVPLKATRCAYCTSKL